MPVLAESKFEESWRALQKLDHPYLLHWSNATEADYEEISNEDFKCEFIDGVLIVHSPATLDHERITAFMLRLLANHAERNRLGQVYGSNAVMQIRLRRFSPDISFLSTAGESRIMDGRVIGPMDLVVEVLSSSTRAYDRGEKLEKYQEGRVPEIWLIDPDEQRVDAHVFASDQYRSTTLRTGRLDSASLPGFAMLVDWLWQRPLPPLDQCRLQSS